MLNSYTLFVIVVCKHLQNKRYIYLSKFITTYSHWVENTHHIMYMELEKPIPYNNNHTVSYFSTINSKV